jgi:hypothetical protein
MSIFYSPFVLNKYLRNLKQCILCLGERLLILQIYISNSFRTIPIYGVFFRSLFSVSLLTENSEKKYLFS